MSTMFAPTSTVRALLAVAIAPGRVNFTPAEKCWLKAFDEAHQFIAQSEPWPHILEGPGIVGVFAILHRLLVVGGLLCVSQSLRNL